MNPKNFEIEQEIQAFVKSAAAKVGDVVWAWDHKKEDRFRGVLIGLNPFEDKRNYMVYVTKKGYILPFRYIEVLT